METEQLEQKRHPIFSRLKSVLRAFKKRPRIIELGERKPQTPALYIANHSAANGPFTYELYFPYSFIPWGTYEMCGSYKERWNYLYHTFYRQKLGWKKLPAFVVASLFATISGMLYKGAELIPTYPDARFKRTLRKSMDALKTGRSVLVFPENSAAGYRDVLEQYHSGFVVLAQRYKKRTGRELPIYTVYYSGKDNVMVIDKPVSLASLQEDYNVTGRERIAEFFKDRTNVLYKQYIQTI